MILVVAATEMEMKPLVTSLDGAGASVEKLVGGVGIVETCLRLTRYLCKRHNLISKIVNVGIGGAYLQPVGRKQPELLDICMAEWEILGDFGIAYGDRIGSLPAGIAQVAEYKLAFDSAHPSQLESAGFVVHCGNFITVNGVSGTAARGEALRMKYDGLCENMEGAAVARVCHAFDIPCVELRAISNMVEDRNPSAWKIREAIERVGEAANLLLEKME